MPDRRAVSPILMGWTDRGLVSGDRPGGAVRRGFSGVGKEVTISVTKVKGEAAGYCLVTAERDG